MVAVAPISAAPRLGEHVCEVFRLRGSKPYAGEVGERMVTLGEVVVMA